MNRHEEAIRDALRRQYNETQHIRDQMRKDEETFLPEIAKDLKIKGERALDDLKDLTIDAIDQVIKEAKDEETQKKTLRGDHITPDAQLLDGRWHLTHDQLTQLVERYADNYTMKSLIRSYIERENQPLDTWPILGMMNDDGGRWDRKRKTAIDLCSKIRDPELMGPVGMALMDQMINDWNA